MLADDDIEGWGAILLSIVIGLLALWFFLALGGMFALLGPWMILAVRHLVRQKRVRKAGRCLRQQAGELVESGMIYSATWKIHPHVERVYFAQSA
jgi:hypothetical protein